MPHEWAEAADAGGDRLPGLRMLADLARQRQELEREFDLDIARRGALRNAGALRLFAFGVILLLTELDVGTEPASLHRDVETGLGILAEHARSAGLAVGGQR